MNRASIKKHLKQRVPSVWFETQDGLGTRMSPHYLECCVPPSEVTALERAAAEIGKKAVWPTCSEIYCARRVIAL